MKINRLVKVGNLMLVGALLIAAPVMAATSTGQFSATCDPASYGYTSDNVYHYHDKLGTLSVKNTQSRTSTVLVTSSNGNNVDVGLNLVQNGTKTWSSVKAGYYKVQAKAAASADCNGWLPGKGNYTFKYSITY